MSLLTLWQCVHAWPQAPEVGLSHRFISRDSPFWLVLEFGKQTRSKVRSCPFRPSGSHHGRDLLMLTLRKDISSSMPSLSNLESEGVGWGGSRTEAGQQRWGPCAKMLASFEEGNSQLFHRISLQEVTQSAHSWLNRPKRPFSGGAKKPNRGSS